MSSPNILDRAVFCHTASRDAAELLAELHQQLAVLALAHDQAAATHIWFQCAMQPTPPAKNASDPDQLALP